MRNIKLTVEYDGTNYHGWQSQTNANTVQDVLREAVRRLTGENCGIIGASRTDVGVHATDQAANFITGSRIPVERVPQALNGILPDDIVVKFAEEVDLDFHSTHSANGKKYRYLIYNSPSPSALMRHRAYHVKQQLDIEAMQEACRHFLGTHDFSSFRASGSNVKTSERTIFEISLKKQADSPFVFSDSKGVNKCTVPMFPLAPSLLELEILGNGFLYNMVRIIAGTLVEVGIGKRSSGDIPVIIAERDRKSAGKTAPAHGLYLVEVYY